MKVGEIAPNFVLKDLDGNDWDLAEHRGKPVVLLFYPGDDTPVCTKQMCSARDRWSDYKETGAEVVGISTDSVSSHRSFADKYGLTVKLLSDEKGDVVNLYGVKSWLPNRAARAVVIIDKNGIVRHHNVERLSIFRPNDDDTINLIKNLGAA